MAIDDTTSLNSQNYGVFKSEERSDNFRVLDKMGVNSLRNKHTIKQKSLDMIEKNIMYFQYNKGFFNTLKDEQQFVDYIKAQTNPPKTMMNKMRDINRTILGQSKTMVRFV